MLWRLLLVMMMVGALAGAVRADEPVLAEERWSESAFGLSLRPPAGAEKIERTADRALVTFLVGEGMSIRVYLRQTQEPVTLDLVRERAVEQFVFSYTNALIVQDDAKEVRIADREGARWYFLVPSEEGEWVAGQAFALIDPYTVAMFQYESDAHSYERSRRIFEAVLDSVQMMSPEELDEQRTALVDAGDAWLAKVTRDRIAAVLPEQQTLRVLAAGEDVGYQWIETTRAQQLGEPGLMVRIRSRLMDGDDQAYDSQSDLFLGDRAGTEVWSSVTTLRSVGDRRESGLQPREALQPHHAHEQSWTDTGLRSRDRLSVSQEGPTQIENRGWNIPPRAYLSQVAVQALPALLVESARAGEPPAPMAFYAYHPNAGRVTLRTVRIEPGPDDGWQVLDRPAPDRAEQIIRFDADGELIERRTGDGRVFRPSTEAEIRAIWAK